MIRQNSFLCFILIVPSLVWAELPIGTPPSGLSWSITYAPSDRETTTVRPASPEHAAALELHRKLVPNLIKTEAFRFGDEFFKIDYYENRTPLQTYINPKMFIEEAWSGEQILASSRNIEDINRNNKALLFFPELAHFDQAQPQGVVPSGKYAGNLKFTVTGEEDKNYRKLVEENLRSQGIQISFDTQEAVEQFIIIDQETKLPLVFFDGSKTAVYEYRSTSQKPELTPAVRKLKERIENP